jgi:hypothetical protein
MAALVVAGIDQHPPRAGFAHLAEGDFHANASITRVIAGCARFFTLYGAFLVKGKLPHTLLLSIHLSSPPVGWVQRALPSILGMKGPFAWPR